MRATDNAGMDFHRILCHVGASAVAMLVYRSYVCCLCNHSARQMMKAGLAASSEGLLGSITMQTTFTKLNPIQSLNSPPPAVAAASVPVAAPDGPAAGAVPAVQRRGAALRAALRGAACPAAAGKHTARLAGCGCMNPIVYCMWRCNVCHRCAALCSVCTCTVRRIQHVTRLFLC